jgi:hypothetical protein
VASVLDSNIINNQTEKNGTGSMIEETACVLCLDPTVLGELLAKYVVGQRSSPRKAAHTFAGFNCVLCGEGLELVLLHDA